MSRYFISMDIKLQFIISWEQWISVFCLFLCFSYILEIFLTKRQENYELIHYFSIDLFFQTKGKNIPFYVSACLHCFVFISLLPLTLKLNNYLLYFQTFFNILEQFWRIFFMIWLDSLQKMKKKANQFMYFHVLHSLCWC